MTTKFDIGKQIVEDMRNKEGMFSAVMDEARDYSIYPWDFRSIRQRSYLVRHGIDADSGYIDCLVLDKIASQVSEYHRLRCYQVHTRMVPTAEPSITPGTGETAATMPFHIPGGE